MICKVLLYYYILPLPKIMIALFTLLSICRSFFFAPLLLHYFPQYSRPVGRLSRISLPPSLHPSTSLSLARSRSRSRSGPELFSTYYGHLSIRIHHDGCSPFDYSAFHANYFFFFFIIFFHSSLRSSSKRNLFPIHSTVLL